jgi:hypothetical protein
MKMDIISAGEKTHLPSDEKEMPFVSDQEPLRSEPKGFTPEQMLKCEVCLRANPPTRTSCFYCAAQLKGTEASVSLQRPTLRKLETWEQGFNVIFLPKDAPQFEEEVLLEAATLLRLDQNELRAIIEMNAPLPLARAAHDEEAALIMRQLSEMGLRAFVISDEDLMADAAWQKRARAFEFTESELVAYGGGGGETWRVAWGDVTLLIEGRLFTRQIEVEERRSRKAVSEMLDAREMMTDEAVLDIHTTQKEMSLRIASRSFDFSCLGASKSLVTVDNFSRLVWVVRERAKHAPYDDSYNRVRRPLAFAWPLEQKTEARGWNRSHPGRVSTEAVTTSDNEMQFTRYSRLRRYLKLNRTEL